MENKLISVKEYAERNGKSVQAVYKQIQGKENSKALEGHIITQKVNNKNVKFLDEDAVKILDEASKQAPTIIIQNEDKELIEQLKAENESLKAQMAELLMKHNTELTEQNKRVLELTERVLLLTENQNKEPENKSFWNRLFK